LDWNSTTHMLRNIALEVVHVVQWFCHYILLHKTTIIAVINPFQYVLTRRFISGKISLLIVSLVFVELILELPVKSGNILPKESLNNIDVFLIASSNPWYGDIFVYLQTLKCPSSASCDELRRIHRQARNYLILDNTLYH
jgi:hypothetical protein